MNRKVNLVFLIALFVAGGWFGNIPTSAGEKEKPQVKTPKTLNEALARLEKVLGRYNPKDQIEWRFHNKDEHKKRTSPSEPEILLTVDGRTTFSHPFREPSAIAFDLVGQWQRKVYDLGKDGKKTLTRRQHSHNVTRYSISRKSGVWTVHAAIISNGVHDAIGTPALRGIVKWHPDGFEFVGIGSVDEYYAARGKDVLATSFGSIRFLRQGDRLVYKVHWQTYHLAKDSKGTILMTPDFKRPIGQPFEKTYKSEPLMGE